MECGQQKRRTARRSIRNHNVIRLRTMQLSRYNIRVCTLGIMSLLTSACHQKDPSNDSATTQKQKTIASPTRNLISVLGDLGRPINETALQEKTGLVLISPNNLMMKDETTSILMSNVSGGHPQMAALARLKDGKLGALDYTFAESAPDAANQIASMLEGYKKTGNRTVSMLDKEFKKSTVEVEEFSNPEKSSVKAFQIQTSGIKRLIFVDASLFDPMEIIPSVDKLPARIMRTAEMLNKQRDAILKVRKELK